ncbi:MAG: ComEC family competence protein [candidate division WS6 bacterium OLB20]|uniref:ComEC family competence protein n=1 Tax=candidate division WS6 bacterium OLB20 TaxID=1617426 RepID=A0A136LYE8_9BACT|nr:MAG: ComEC family competence protein [candidate division WS6 bacterium OLB20]
MKRLRVLAGYPLLLILIPATGFLIGAEKSAFAHGLLFMSASSGAAVMINRRFLLLVPLLALLVLRYFSTAVPEHIDAHVTRYLNGYYEVTGIVVSQPYTDLHRKRFRLLPLALSDDAGSLSVRGGLILVTTGRYVRVEQGQRVTFTAQIEQPESFDGFDYPGYLRTLDVYAVADAHTIEVTADAGFPDSLLVSARNGIREKLQMSLPEPHAALVIGMLIGTREEFYQDFDGRLSLTGTTHMIAVSGFNVTLLITLILSLAGRIHRKKLMWIAAVGILLFLGIVGADNQPALRATIMGLAMLAGKVSGRRGAVANSLGLALFCMLLINPLSLFSLSLQLSFAATLGLIVIEPRLRRIVPRLFGTLIREELSLTLAANVATLPVTVSSFGTVPLISPIANLAVGPLVPIIMLFGFLILPLSLLPVINDLAAVPAWIVTELFVRIITFFLINRRYYARDRD